MQTETVALTREKETLLITLWAKAGESLLPDSLLKDRFAAEAAARIDYDFARLKVDRDLMVGLAMRAHTLDGWTRDFLAGHADALVLHLGCGLDSRVFRVDPAGGIDWYDVDYPEVIALRRKLYPGRDSYHLIGSSVTEQGWLEALPQDRPAMIVAEGLLPYLPEEEARRIVSEQGMHMFTPATIQTYEELKDELKKVTIQGYAVDDGEYHIGLTSVGAPIYDDSGIVRYCFGIVSMFHRNGSPEFIFARKRAVEAARDISRALGYQGHAFDEV